MGDISHRLPQGGALCNGGEDMATEMAYGCGNRSMLMSGWIRMQKEKSNQDYIKTSRPVSSDPLLPASPHLLTVPQFPMTVSPTRDQMFKHMSLLGIFHIQT